MKLRTIIASLAVFAALPACAAGGGGAAGPAAIIKPVIRYDTCTWPEYPRADLVAEHDGIVRFAFLVSKDGKMLRSRSVSSSGWPGLDAAAEQALLRCQAKPGLIAGTPSEMWIEATYIWQLQDDQGPSAICMRMLEAARKGDAAAIYALSTLGCGDMDAAGRMALLRRAADAGVAGAQYVLGGAYLRGTGGVGQDTATGLDWIRKAAAQGYLLAVEDLKLYAQLPAAP